MDNILLMTASPRKGGNCDDAARIVLDELDTRDFDARSFRLDEFRIERCRGCLACQRGQVCGIADDFQALWGLVKAAKTIVWFVPVYWCSPPGLMKDFMDRTVVDFAAGVMKGKAVHLVSIAQSAGYGPQEKIVSQWVRWLGGSSLKTKLRLAAFHTGELAANARAVNKLKKLAWRIV
ncbi:MAG: flavodoxin family protein [Lentisphaerae bacterium]|nr:flavodoxin family protein [Lentisphaerota bacterium]